MTRCVLELMSILTLLDALDAKLNRSLQRVKMHLQLELEMRLELDFSILSRVQAAQLRLYVAMVLCRLVISLKFQRNIYCTKNFIFK